MLTNVKSNCVSLRHNEIAYRNYSTNNDIISSLNLRSEHWCVPFVIWPRQTLILRIGCSSSTRSSGSRPSWMSGPTRRLGGLELLTVLSCSRCWSCSTAWSRRGWWPRSRRRPRTSVCGGHFLLGPSSHCKDVVSHGFTAATLSLPDGRSRAFIAAILWLRCQPHCNAAALLNTWQQAKPTEGSHAFIVATHTLPKQS